MPTIFKQTTADRATANGYPVQHHAWLYSYEGGGCYEQTSIGSVVLWQDNAHSKVHATHFYAIPNFQYFPLAGYWNDKKRISTCTRYADLTENKPLESKCQAMKSSCCSHIGMLKMTVASSSQKVCLTSCSSHP